MCVGREAVKDTSTRSKDERDTDGIRLITNEELRSHNTPKSAWAVVHGKVLDITEFAKRHPGGDMILLVAGKEATVLFETYHPRGVPSSLVEKLTVSHGWLIFSLKLITILFLYILRICFSFLFNSY